MRGFNIRLAFLGFRKYPCLADEGTYVYRVDRGILTYFNNKDLGGMTSKKVISIKQIALFFFYFISTFTEEMHNCNSEPDTTREINNEFEM